MKAVDPRIDPKLVPAGTKPILMLDKVKNARRVTFPCIQLPSGDLITRWRLSADDRKRLMEGEDLYVVTIFSSEIPPMEVYVGAKDWTQ